LKSSENPHQTCAENSSGAFPEIGAIVLFSRTLSGCL
jgi:hypothetical protein